MAGSPPIRRALPLDPLLPQQHPSQQL
uniref:Uncharacterized protein n=1 Tax=Arundo donax TaxID=35708 RepID=A0A0A9B4Y9_ARUDO